jgi:hypothetical protein
MNIPGFSGLSHIADFRLKCCILKEDTKNNISVNYFYIASFTLK